MKNSKSVVAFTLIELLVVMAIIGILLYLMTPQIVSRRHDGRMHPNCMNNQKQIALAITMSAEDNDGKFPWQLPVATNGTLELITNGQPAAQFRALENYLKAFSCYICPSDAAKTEATNYENFTDRNTSFFVNVDATNSRSATALLTGDRHLAADGHPVRPGIFVYTNGGAMDWTHELHNVGMVKCIGAASFTDAHSEVIKGEKLADIFQRQGVASERLLVP